MYMYYMKPPEKRGKLAPFLVKVTVTIGRPFWPSELVIGDDQ